MTMGKRCHNNYKIAILWSLILLSYVSSSFFSSDPLSSNSNHYTSIAHESFNYYRKLQNEKAKYYFKSELQHLLTQSEVISDLANSHGGIRSADQNLIIESVLHAELSFVKNIRLNKHYSNSINVSALSTDDSAASNIDSILTENNKRSRAGDLPFQSLQVETATDNVSVINLAHVDFEQMYSYFNCDEWAADMTKPFYTPEMWDYLRNRLSHWNMERTIEFIAPKIDDNEAIFYTKHSRGKGRGVFASRDIQKGELVHSGIRDTVFFRDGLTWSIFVMSLERKIACDVLEWTWMQDVTKSGDYFLCLNLGNAAYLNNGGENDSNIGPISGSSLDLYATRLIKKHEELLYDYDLFETNWDEFGL